MDLEVLPHGPGADAGDNGTAPRCHGPCFNRARGHDTRPVQPVRGEQQPCPARPGRWTRHKLHVSDSPGRWTNGTVLRSRIMKTSKIVLAGATGWAGSALAHGIADATDLELVGAVSRTYAGQSLGDALNREDLAAPVFASAKEAVAGKPKPDIFVEYTKPNVALANVLAALEAGTHVVVGTSGLTDEDYSVIAAKADEKRLGVLAVGNFSLTAVLMMRFATMAAKWLPSWELIDYASDKKVDAPSGTARELAHRLSQVAEPRSTVPVDEVQGVREARGGTVGTTQVHSVRLPNYVLAVESIFGMESESLTIRHDAGSSATPYVAGALIAIRGVSELVGLHRGLDAAMDLG